MLISRHIRDNIDLALIEAFIHHRFPTLEFSSSKVCSSTHTIVIITEMEATPKRMNNSLVENGVLKPNHVRFAIA